MAINMRAPVETDEADPRPVKKDPWDWPSRKLYMGSYPKRVPDAFTHHSALWDAEGQARTQGAPNLRNRKVQP